MNNVNRKFAIDIHITKSTDVAKETINKHKTHPAAIITMSKIETCKKRQLYENFKTDTKNFRFLDTYEP